MKKRCTFPDCYAPGVTCANGEPSIADCEHWKASASSAEGDSATLIEIDGDNSTVPWSGSAFGLVDLMFTGGRGTPRVVAVIGGAGAGKTTVLGSWYLMLSRGALTLGAAAFAGSYTLSGWENIAHSLRWDNDGGPGFPPHTPSGEGRAPGLLHMALRNNDRRMEDVLFADAPGEWFRAWSVNRDAPEAEGARWLAEHASVIILAADCEALAGPSKGNARMTLQALAQRIASERRDRPVALVWTKADIDVPTDVRGSVTEAVRTHLGDVPTFEISVKDSEEKGAEAAFQLLMDWIVRAPSPKPALVEGRPKSADPFLAYGHV